jgi:hypothetical protein
MCRRTLLGAILPGLVLFSVQAVAVPFAPLEPYSFSMGGTGVSSGTRANAVFLNPALLAAEGKSEDYLLGFPLVGIRFAGKDSVTSEIDTYQNKSLETVYDTALSDFVNNNYTDKNTARTAVQEAAFRLSSQLKRIDNRPMEAEFIGGLVVGIPNRKYAASLVIDSRVIGGAIVKVDSADTTALDAIVNDGSDPVLLDPNVFDTSQMNSTLQGRGLSIAEIGVALSRGYTVYGHDIDFGVTPKYLRVTSFDYVDNNLESANFDANQGKKTHTTVDVDVGAVKHYGNGWTSGVAVKNLFGQRYKTARGNTIKVTPQARLGISHHTDYVTVALDLDLNESESLGFDAPTQYLAFGAELNVFDINHVRIGYRQNMSDTTASIATTGIGFSAYGAKVDLAVGANEDEISFSAQMQFTL